MRYLLISALAAFLISGCAKKVSTSGTATTPGKYSEDLSMWRPEVVKVTDSASMNQSNGTNGKTNKYVQARHSINQEVDVILDSISEQNLSRRALDGYTIQVYSGTKREDALNVKKKMTQTVPDLESEVQYRQPNFRVRTGKYYSRLDAQKDYLAVKRYFPNAIVIPDVIPVD